ncbi:phytanoyl-CoA dioxygenase family protein [Chitinimonas sp. BJYL2]|uniref:phytanoyl-CoA dioxygenase family protein n=1 Tax=Chitinimonas sp. BJYL2 TaxID=2976696 RepID=UPI0022B5B3F1|nr:phytanoyl-CoA dioxygenase family protein [Chitinimonas sp. BJYL2]
MNTTPFTPAELAEFETRGFLIARGLADPSLCDAILGESRRQLDAAIAPIEYEADTQYPGAPRSRDAEGGRTARRLQQMYARAPVFREWACNPVVTRRVSQLLGGASVALTQAHHNSLMTKQPAYSSETHWHRDIRYWSFSDSDLISVWLALGHETRENGCLGFLPGSHQLELDNDRFESRAFLRTDLPENRVLIDSAEFPELAPGDVVFFHARTFHAAGWNRTQSTKYSLVFSYHRQDNQPVPGTRSASLPSITMPAD